MIPVKQTIFKTETTKGNCLTACVASIFDLPIEKVPYFAEFEDDWQIELINFVEKLGYYFAGTSSPGQKGLKQLNDPKYNKGVNGYIIVTGKSPRGDFLHSVVYKDGKLAHDPHPDNTGIENIEYFFMIECTTEANICVGCIKESICETKKNKEGRIYCNIFHNMTLNGRKKLL
jgi:hypothetical protein